MCAPASTARREFFGAVAITAFMISSGERPAVVLANGIDRYNYFDQAARPSGNLTDAEFEYCYEDMRTKAKMLFKGVDEGKGKRYQ